MVIKCLRDANGGDVLPRGRVSVEVMNDVNVMGAGGGGLAMAGRGEVSVARYHQVEEAGRGGERGVECQEVSAGVGGK